MSRFLLCPISINRFYERKNVFRRFFFKSRIYFKFNSTVVAEEANQYVQNHSKPYAATYKSRSATVGSTPIACWPEPTNITRCASFCIAASSAQHRRTTSTFCAATASSPGISWPTGTAAKGTKNGFLRKDRRPMWHRCRSAGIVAIFCKRWFVLIFFGF